MKKVTLANTDTNNQKRLYSLHPFNNTEIPLNKYLYNAIFSIVEFYYPSISNFRKLINVSIDHTL